MASNRYTPFYYDETPSNCSFHSFSPSPPFTSYWRQQQQQQERRPIIGANCYKHRNYYAVMAAQQQAAQIASSSTPSGNFYGTRAMDGSIPTTSSCYLAEQPQPQEHHHQLLQQPLSFAQSPAMRMARPLAQPQSLMQPPRTMLPSSTIGAPRPQLVTPRGNIPNNDEDEGIDCSPCFGNDTFRRTFRLVVLGQILSLCLCGTGVTSQLLAGHNVNTPAAQSFLNYFFLCSFYGTILVFKTGDNSLLPVIRKRGWKYFLLSLIDVEANYFIVYAYQFTNLTSIQLLDCSTIPMVLVLSWLFLSVRYLLTHIVGVCICLVGIAILIWADVLEGKGLPGGSNRLIGDIFCVIGSLLYATGNVGEEFLIKQTSRTEYLGMIGLFGSIISGIQLAALEHNELARVRWSGAIIGLYLLFAASMFIFYSLVAVVMQKASALMFNLSILTADFYTLLFGLFFFKYEFHVLYFVSFAVVVSGSILYSLRPTQRRDPEEPRRVCPCCFWCFYWCCGCCCDGCYEQNGSNQGSLDVTPMPPASAVSTLATSTSPIPLELAMHLQRFGGTVPGAGVGLGGGAVHYCPVHGPSTATCSPSLITAQHSAETRS